MNIEQQLRILREGSVVDTDTEFDEELVESWFLSSESSLHESASDSSFGELMVEMATLMEAGTATPDETLSLLTKIRIKWKQMKDRFSPYEGIKDLKLIRTAMERAESRLDIRVDKDDVFGTIISLAIAAIQIFARYRNYKNMDVKVIKEYISEAEQFRNGLYKQIKAADSKHDFKASKRLNRILKKLDTQIAQFKSKARIYGGHTV